MASSICERALWAARRATRSCRRTGRVDRGVVPQARREAADRVRGFRRDVAAVKTADNIDDVRNRRVDYILSDGPPTYSAAFKPSWKLLAQTTYALLVDLSVANRGRGAFRRFLASLKWRPDQPEFEPA